MELRYEKNGDYLIPALQADEQPEAGNQMLWVQKMNGIRQSAEEIVLSELIYS